MHQGQLVFAQLMRHLPLTTFRRCVARYAGEHKVKSFSCLDQYLCMAFAQLTYRESLRDIEASLRAQCAKLYHLGIRGNVARNTLANANAVRDWRIYANFAERLIGIARGLYAEEPFGVDLAETVYALDATTIDLCLSVFPWAPFRSTKAAVKLHTLLDLRGNIPSFIHISDGKMHDVNALELLSVSAAEKGDVSLRLPHRNGRCAGDADQSRHSRSYRDARVHRRYTRGNHSDRCARVSLARMVQLRAWSGAELHRLHERTGRYVVF
jgi:hypothetical protein